LVSLSGGTLSKPEMLDRMGRLLRHRGPDHHGTATHRGAAFGAERLRVIDLSPAADQPFATSDGQILLAVNGAIYNAAELRRRYNAFEFQSRSDSETVLPLYLDRGVEGFADLDGMFAIAIYDGRTGELVLARDRAGEKPLFYKRVGDEIWFASEMQALLDYTPRFSSLDSWAIRDFLTLGYVTEPRTIFRDINRVGAGTVESFGGSRHRFHQYWDCGSAGVEAVSPADAAEHLEQLLISAVEKQLTADVSVGVFSSGGVDSSLLTALAVDTLGNDRVQTFSVGFTQRKYDESRHARWMAERCSTRHVEVVATETALSGALKIIVERVAEPVADPAILPTYLLARAARDHVTVVLSGEGADELFGGYPTYLGHQAAALYQRLPAPTRRALAIAVNAVPASKQGKVPLEYLLKRFVASAELELVPRHMDWFGTGLRADTWQDQFCPEYNAPEFPPGRNDIDRASLFDFRTYLRDNLLTKIDRATMLASLESRAPYLDSGVVQFALALAPSLKIKGTTTKWLLKRVARRWLPRSTVKRKKRGLSVPVSQWLNGGLRPDVDRLLAPDRIDRQGLLQGAKVAQLVTEHGSGKVNNSRALWPLLMLEYWIERWAPED
jgi:asparagine synthase (glutamine-hydrolysing)